jgi:hypothetical protein
MDNCCQRPGKPPAPPGHQSKPGKRAVASPAASKSGPPHVPGNTPTKSPEKKKTKIVEDPKDSVNKEGDQVSSPKQLDSTFDSVVDDEDIHGPTSSVPWH